MDMHLGGWLWMVVWVGALIVMVWILVAGGRSPAGESPLEILRRRYAAGQITEEEFRHARDVLGTGGNQS
ncbi:MAG TPA: SHOCT domain-containing protein [Candidatus Limnocylindria bacterium]|jgi:putative membrane protein